MTNLINWLYDYVGEERDVKDSAFADFVSNRMDNGEFLQYNTVEDVEVPDADVDAWGVEFDKWLAQ